MPHTYHIIGAGLAGLAAGIKLTQAGAHVTLYEAAPRAGGRCRSYFDTALGRVIDNGNHLIVGANPYALSYIKAIDSHAAFLTGRNYAFIDLATGSQYAFQPTWALAALARLALARKSQVTADCFQASSALFRRFVEPFCISALNTAPTSASAALLRRTLWELVRHGRQGLRYYLPRTSLAAGLIEPALAKLENVHFASAVKELVWKDDKVEALQMAGQRINIHGGVILAASMQAAARLLPAAGLKEETSAIVNGHFLCPELAWPRKRDFIGLTGGTAEWLFYRDGVLSTTTSAANALAEKDQPEIARLLWADACKALGHALPLPAHRIIVEKRATRLATPASLAPVRTQYGNLFLAGDYTVTDRPATIDSAVKSGFAAAQKAFSCRHR